MENKFEQLRKDALAEIDKLTSSQEFINFKEKYFAKGRGLFTALTKELKNLAAELKPIVGAKANEVKKQIEEKLGEKMREAGVAMIEDLPAGRHGASEGEWIDPTISIQKYKLGTLHPMTQMIRDVEEVFKSMGFLILDGPELESDYYNFEALNFPANHPARDSYDTFYVETGSKEKLLLRAHTSTMQVRALEKYGAPLRCVVPGRVFRNEATDASHDHTFYQVEGMMVGEDISAANLIAMMEELVSGIYKKEMNVRLRPGYFPFTEPSFELDISCVFCEGKGCRVCKQTGWIEMGGSGVMHPNVLKYGGIDTKKYSGFAFGMGLTRLLMMKYGISDIRLLHGGDLRFLKQF